MAGHADWSIILIFGFTSNAQQTASNAPDRPLMGSTEFEKENYYDKIAERVG